MKDVWRHPVTILAVAAGSVLAVSAIGRGRRMKRRRGAKTSSQSVQIYGATWCPACMELKKVLGERGVPFAFRDIDKDKAADTFVMQQSEEGIIPVTTVNGKTFMGYTPDDIEDAYRTLQA